MLPTDGQGWEGQVWGAEEISGIALDKAHFSTFSIFFLFLDENIMLWVFNRSASPSGF